MRGIVVHLHERAILGDEVSSPEECLKVSHEFKESVCKGALFVLRILGVFVLVLVLVSFVLLILIFILLLVVFVILVVGA